MPGLIVDRYTSSGETKSRGGHKLTFPTSLEPPETGSMMAWGADRCLGFSPDKTARSALKNSIIASMEAPEMEFFETANIGSPDYASMDTDIANGSSIPMMFSSSDFAPARHSTACCTDLALRREIRQKFANQQQRQQQQQQENQNGYSLANSSSTLTLGHSFRRGIGAEDRVENLQLWEEFDKPLNGNKVVPYSWHGESHGNHSGKKLENSFRKTKGLVQGFLQTLGFSSRRSSSGAFRRAS